MGVVGGGILGVAIAREVVRRRPGHRGGRAGEGGPARRAPDRATTPGSCTPASTTGRAASRPSSARAGRLLLKEFCAEHAIPYDECGKLVVAVDASEMGRFDALERTATDNGVPGLRRLVVGGDPRGRAARRRAGRAALAGHRDHRLRRDHPRDRRRGRRRAAVRCGCRRRSSASGARAAGSTVQVAGGGGPLAVDHLVVAAGLQSDRVAALVGADPSPAILPFRGEYLAVSRAKQELVRGMVYPVPDPRYPFLGVHFTRRVSGELEVGPNAVLATRREGYRRRDVSAADLRDVLTWPGFWRLARAHWRTGIDEVVGSASHAGLHAQGVALRARDRRRRRGARRQRGARAGGRPRRQPGRRLPHRPGRRRHPRAQRPVAGGDVEPGDRCARRRPDVGLIPRVGA